LNLVHKHEVDLWPRVAVELNLPQIMTDYIHKVIGAVVLAPVAIALEDVVSPYLVLLTSVVFTLENTFRALQIHL
jgi:hypothetical protein